MKAKKLSQFQYYERLYKKIVTSQPSETMSIKDILLKEALSLGTNSIEAEEDVKKIFNIHKAVSILINKACQQTQNLKI